MAPARRTRKATVDYTVLSGQRRRSTAHTQSTRKRRGKQPEVAQDVEMSDRTQDPVLTCAVTELEAQYPGQAPAVAYFRQYLEQQPPIPRGVFIFLTDLMRRQPDFLASFFAKQWILSGAGLICNANGRPLTYEVAPDTGIESLFDPFDFSTPSLPTAVAAPGSSTTVDDTSLNTTALEAEKRRLDALPEQFGLFSITEVDAPTRRVAGGSATLARMHAQRPSQQPITSYFAAKRANTSSSSLLPAATITEAPRSGGPPVLRIPTAAEQARQGALVSTANRSLAPGHPYLGSELDRDGDEADTDLDGDGSDDDEDDDNDPSRCRPRPRISDLPEDLRSVVLTACNVFRVLIVTRMAFPDVVQRASLRQTAWGEAWKIHQRQGDPMPITSTIRRLLDQRMPQVRGDLKLAARGLIVGNYNLDGLTPTERTNKVLTLIGERMFQLHYECIDEIGTGTGRKFANRSIAELLVLVMFRGGSTSEGARFYRYFNPVSTNLLALLVLSLMVALQEHMAGNQRMNVSFRAATFQQTFARVKATIESYKEQRPDRFEDIATSILNKCRAAAGIVGGHSAELYPLAASP